MTEYSNFMGCYRITHHQALGWHEFYNIGSVVNQIMKGRVGRFSNLRNDAFANSAVGDADPGNICHQAAQRNFGIQIEHDKTNATLPIPGVMLKNAVPKHLPQEASLVTSIHATCSGSGPQRSLKRKWYLDAANRMRDQIYQILEIRRHLWSNMITH